MMDALHEVAGVAFVPPEWVTKKNLAPKRDVVIAIELLVNVFRCPDCMNVFEAKMVKQRGASFTDVLSQSEKGENQARKEGSSDLTGAGRGNLKFENKSGSDHVRKVWRDVPVGFMRNRPKPGNAFGLNGKRRLSWAEKGKWVTNPSLAKNQGRNGFSFGDQKKPNLQKLKPGS